MVVTGMLFVFVGCGGQQGATMNDSHTQKAVCKQENSAATDWVLSWRSCSGDGAIKSDGSLWQFGKVGGCNWGQIEPVAIDPKTGKYISTVKKKYVYHLKGERIGSGFRGAKIINGRYRVYAIKKDGILWGWGEGLGREAKQLSPSKNWVDFGVKWAGNGCCAHDVGLQKDGSLWRFPEDVDFENKNPMPYLKKIGRQTGWDKVILYCCGIYAMKSDGVIWVNKGLDAKGKFIKYTMLKDHYDEDKDFYTKLKNSFKTMPSRSMLNYEEHTDIHVNYAKKAGTLCLLPEEVTVYRRSKK